MYIDKVDIKGWGKALQMPIEYEIRKALEKIGYKVGEEKDGLFWAEKGESFFYVIASSKVPNRFVISMEAYLPPDIEDKDHFVATALEIARNNGAPRIGACLMYDKCYVSQEFKRRYNAISPSRLQRNIDEYFAGLNVFVLNERLVYETYKAL